MNSSRMLMLAVVLFLVGCTTGTVYRLMDKDGNYVKKGSKEAEKAKLVPHKQKKLLGLIPVSEEPIEEEKEKSGQETVNSIADPALGWMAVGCFGLSVVSAIIAYVSKGWAFFGGLSAFLVVLGLAALSLVIVIHYLWVGVVVAVVCIILRVLYKNKDFSLFDKLRKKKDEPEEQEPPAPAEA